MAMTVDRATAFELWIAVIKHAEAFRAKPPIRLVIGIFADVVCEDEFILQESADIFAGQSIVCAPFGAAALLPEPIPKHAVAFEAPPPIRLLVRIFSVIVRQDKVNLRVRQVTIAVCRTDALLRGVAAPEYSVALLAQPPIRLMELVFGGVVWET
jgi:hypothetical protein